MTRAGIDAFAVGEVTVTQVEERIYSFPIAGFVPGATPDALTPHLDWLRDYGVVDVEQMTMPVNGYLLESEGTRILVDTCVGLEHPDSEPSSPFVDRLQLAGFDPASVDVVVCTHFHYDHVGWNTTLVGEERVPTFRNARYLFARAEWDAVQDWTQSSELDEMLQASFGRQVGFLVDNGLAELTDSALQLTSEVRLLPTPGHSPGHVAVEIVSGGRRAIITGDAVHHPVQLADPSITTEADDDPAGTVTTRTNLIDRILDTDVLLIGSHFGAPGRGYLRTEGSRVVFGARPPGSTNSETRTSRYGKENDSARA
jgi:glyoxylase-like metal-dependent hydrolase (beta-lactamase superfamily II)